MASLLDILEMYVQEERACPYTTIPGYRTAARNLEQHLEAFQATLSAPQSEQLENIMQERARIRHMEDLAMLRAAVSIGLELSRF